MNVCVEGHTFLLLSVISDVYIRHSDTQGIDDHLKKKEYKKVQQLDQKIAAWRFKMKLLRNSCLVNLATFVVNGGNSKCVFIIRVPEVYLKWHIYPTLGAINHAMISQKCNRGRPCATVYSASKQTMG